MSEPEIVSNKLMEIGCTLISHELRGRGRTLVTMPFGSGAYHEIFFIGHFELLSRQLINRSNATHVITLGCYLRHLFDFPFCDIIFHRHEATNRVLEYRASLRLRKVGFPLSLTS